MANAIYPKWKEALMQASANSSLGGTVKLALLDSTYTYSAAHEFYSSVSGVVGTPVTLASKTFTDGVFDAADVVFTALSGSQVQKMLLFIDTAVAGTSRLVVYLDTGYTGLPFTPNGADLPITFPNDATRIFKL